MTPEGKVKAMVRREIAKYFPDSYRFCPVQNGMGAPALDFYYSINGRFIAVETKRAGKLPTSRQLQTMREINAAGGKVFVVRDEASLKEMIDELHMNMWPRCLPWVTKDTLCQF